MAAPRRRQPRVQIDEPEAITTPAGTTTSASVTLQVEGQPPTTTTTTTYDPAEPVTPAVIAAAPRPEEPAEELDEWPALLALLAGRFEEIFLTTDETEWGRLIDERVVELRRIRDGVTWPQLQQERERLGRLCTAIRELRPTRGGR